MELRHLRPEEFETSMELAMYAFQFKLPPERMEGEKNGFKPERVWGIFDNGKLEAQLMLIPLQIYVNGKELSMGGVAGVSTWPEHRRRGHVARLLEHALKQMRDDGQSISCLAPFSFGFYRKFGWEIYTDYKKYSVDTALFPPRTETSGRVVRTDTGEIPLLSRLYEEYASRYNGMLKRNEEWWTTSVFRRKKGNVAVYYRPDGEPAGYMIYEAVQRILTVHEMAYADEEARQALWTYIANHDSMVDKALLTAPMDDALPFMLPNPRIGQEIVPYFMARIVDVAAFARQYAFTEPAAEVHLTVKLADRHAPWNEGVWRLAVGADGSGIMKPLSPEDCASAPDLACEINAWTALLMGYMRPVQLHGIGRLTGSADAVALLETLVRPRQTYLMDFF